MDKLVDFLQPIEAVNCDTDEVVPVKLGTMLPNPDEDGCYILDTDSSDLLGGRDVYWPDGNPWADGPWYLRNVVPAKPSTPSNEELTQRMEKAIRRHVAGKMDLHDDRRGPNITVEAEFRSIVEQLGVGTQASARDAAFALVTEMAKRDAPLGVFGYDCFKRAREIADLPKLVDPIDPDLLIARKLAHEAHGGTTAEFLDGQRDDSAGVKWRLEGIKAGRTLAAAGTAHE